MKSSVLPFNLSPVNQWVMFGVAEGAIAARVPLPKATKQQYNGA